MASLDGSIVRLTPLKECFKESARILRWKLRAWAKKGRQRDKIMEIESIQTILYLGLEILVRRPKEVSRKLLMVLFSIVWVSINFRFRHWNQKVRNVKYDVYFQLRA